MTHQDDLYQRQNEAWCIELLKIISPKEKMMVAKSLDIFSRVKSVRGINRINKILMENNNND